MHSAVETLSPTRVRLTVTVGFDELKPDMDAAYKRVGGQVRVQGFRPGKVPPRILDQRIGRGAIVEEAVNSAIPRLYGEAVQSEEIVPVAQPEVAVTELADGDKLAFTAEVDVRPRFDLPAYDTLAVTVDAVEVTDAEVDQQLEELRERFASLRPVERPAQDGDFVAIDLAATVDGAEVPGGTATDLSYRVGEGDLLEGADEALRGASAGDARSFTTTLVAGEYEGRTAEVAVTVRSVNERELPVADDEWASTATGFDSLEALRSDIRERLARSKRVGQGVSARDKVLEALLAQIEVPLPESAVDAELAWRRRSTETQLRQAGLELAAYLEGEGKSEEDFDAELRTSAEEAVKAQFVLDAVADHEQLDVTEGELSDQVVRRAARAGIPPQQYAESIVQAGQLGALMQELRRGKALATVMGAATVTDTAGARVDLEALRNDLGPAAELPDVQVDEDGRSYHVHPDGEVHFLDEE